jgi:transaldolase
MIDRAVLQTAYQGRAAGETRRRSRGLVLEGAVANLLDQLKQVTVVVADTGDMNSMKVFRPRDATTNPSLITAAAQMPEYSEIVDEALRWAQKEAGNGGSDDKVVKLALDRLAVQFGLEILKLVPGRVSTEVDARLSYDMQATLDKARELIKQYNAAGISNDRVLIKIAATWEGIKAAEILEKEGIHCNLTLLFGMHQAVACAEAKVTLISPFVGRILDWHKKTHNRDFVGAEDPGVISVTRIYNYYKHFGHQTEVMGASFRNTGEITELAGSDLLTIAPNLLKQLSETEGKLERKLDPEKAKTAKIERLSFDEASFRAAHEEDKMAKEKTAEGIDGFSKAIVTLEKLLLERISKLSRKTRAGHTAKEIFGIYDLDGDGLITREEWGGSMAVFAALDTDGDGVITPDEMAMGLGAAFLLKQ